MAELLVEDLVAALDGTPVLRGVDLHVPSGSLLALLGPSGCGKTTLLRVIAGFLAQDRGRVLLGGRELAGPAGAVPVERRRIGIVPQEGALFPHLDVAGNVGFGLGRRSRGRRERVAELLDLIGMAEFAGRRPAELSGGQQQRVALARALAPGPDLVLLDEPFSALDAGLRAGLREDVRRVLTAAGATAVLVTHDQAEALSIADLVAVMDGGRIRQCGSPVEVYRAPADVAVAGFVGEAVVLAARECSGTSTSVLGRHAVRGHGNGAGNGNGTGKGTGAAAGVDRERPGHVVLRPEQVRLLPAGQGLPAEVVTTWYFGHDALVQLRLTDHPETRVLARCSGSVPAAGPVGVQVEGDVLFLPEASPAGRGGPAPGEG